MKRIIICLSIVVGCLLNSEAQEVMQGVQPSRQSVAYRERVQQDPDTVYFAAVEQLPEPIGGIVRIQSLVVYPEIARRAGIQGTVYVEAYIDETGTVRKTKIVKGIGAGCDEAAQEAVAKTKFAPGMQEGKPVKTRIAIPIRFRLAESPSEAPTDHGKASETVDKPTVRVLAGPNELEKLIRYPAIAVRAGIQGTVHALMRVNSQGINSLSIQEGIGAGCDEQVLRAVAELYALGSTSPEKEKALSIAREKGVADIRVVVQFLLPKKK